MNELILNFLNETCFSFDYNILSLVHSFYQNFGWIFKPLFLLVDMFGNKAIGYFFLVVILFFSKKYKKESYLIFFSIVLCFIFNEIFVKNYIQRVRPFLSDIIVYKEWWKFAGEKNKDSFSFMSGHTLLVVSCFFAVFFNNKSIRFLLFTILFTILTILSRLVFVLHYPTDCLFGIIFGIIFALISYIVITKIYKYLISILNKIFPFAFKNN